MQQVKKKMSNDASIYPNGPEKYIKAGQKKMTITVVILVVIMISFFAWSYLGYIDISKKTIAFSKEGTLYVVIKEDLIDSVGIGTKITIDGVDYVADFEPFELYHMADKDFKEDFMKLPWIPKISRRDYLSNFGLKKSPLPEGWYVATIQLQRCHPIKLLFE